MSSSPSLALDRGAAAMDMETKRALVAQLLDRPRQSYSDIWQNERWWVDHQPWLERHGYMLRPRYRPGWKPSWHTTKAYVLLAEDHKPLSYPFLLDATRISDGTVVMLKRVNKERHPMEVEITTMLSSPPFSSDPRNHCVPVFEVLQDPDDDKFQLMVLPLLRAYADPRFDTIGEAVDCFRQVIQCVQFLHENKIAHRDIHLLNIMMDASPLYHIPFHPLEQGMRRDFKGDSSPAHTRSEKPVKYYIIDFGLSIRYDTVDPPPMEYPVLGGDKLVPEFVGDDPSERYSGLSKLYDPFPTDVYCLGSWIRQDFLDGYKANGTGHLMQSKRLGFEFLRPLVNDMTQSDPSKRPSMDQVVERFETVVSSLSSWKLRSRVAKEEDHPLHSLCLATAHWMRRVKLVASRRSAVPSPDI
ncbi:kinase-like domain-containing protein [Schizophyllum amplum]|uniref:Kinase-like domain-containing protein n=1 Tax=Schizophyllum amplum TaxID=97359 RepID=A0A550C8V4_9AGAR|nr:kinase-like domain-containing protein [Auriculariopsis ampla]